MGKMNLMIETFDYLENKITILEDNFNLFFVHEADGGSPLLKRFSFSKLLEIKKKNNLCNIWIIRKTKEKRFTVRQKHRSGFLKRRSDFFLCFKYLAGVN